MKKCSRCKTEQHISGFYKDISHTDGLKSECKRCHSKYFKSYRQNHKEEIKKRRIKYRKTYNYKENKKQYDEKYRKTHKKQYQNYSKKHYYLNRQKCISRVKKYRKTPSGKASRRNTKYRRKTIYKNTNITLQWLRELFTIAKLCPLCGVEMLEDGRLSNGKTLDHMIPLGVGGTHTMDNVRVTCRKCNLSRPKDGSDYTIKPLLDILLPLL